MATAQFAFVQNFFDMIVKPQPESFQTNMAQIQNRKGNFYSQKQFIRDELLAPQHLESAGDTLIKHLAKKQMNTCTTLKEQLAVVQHFEKGFDLNPDNRKGITCLAEFKKHALEQSAPSTPLNSERISDLNELMRNTGLTRHELELSLSEKPNSAISQLYMFAIGNKRRKSGNDDLSRNHPLNELKKIEAECFGQKTKSDSEPVDQAVKKEYKRKKQRKRKRKSQKGANLEKRNYEPESRKSPISLTKEKEHPKAPFFRPSLWDVKDMKKWSESKKVGCKPPALYTIKNGEIIKLKEELQNEKCNK